MFGLKFFNIIFVIYDKIFGWFFEEYSKNLVLV